MLRFLRNTPLKNRNIRNNLMLSTAFPLLIHRKTEFEFGFEEVFTLKTAVTYARFSSARQHETSIEAQRDAMAKWCAQRSVRIVQEYADRAASGTKTEGRDDFLQMLADLKQRRVDYVLVHKYDRFARNENDQYLSWP